MDLKMVRPTGVSWRERTDRVSRQLGATGWALGCRDAHLVHLQVIGNILEFGRMVVDVCVDLAGGFVNYHCDYARGARAGSIAHLGCTQ